MALGTLVRPSMGTATPKPGKGDADLQKKLDAKAERLKEDREKAKARKRDSVVGGCRWPKDKCPCCSQGLPMRKEVAHRINKSQGGANDVTNLISLVYTLHQGAKSLHSGDRRITPLDKAKGTSGPCRFETKVNGVWMLDGVERSVGVFIK